MEKIAIDFKLFIGGSNSLTQYFLSVVLSVLREDMKRGHPQV